MNNPNNYQMHLIKLTSTKIITDSKNDLRKTVLLLLLIDKLTNN